MQLPIRAAAFLMYTSAFTESSSSKYSMAILMFLLSLYCVSTLRRPESRSMPARVWAALLQSSSLSSSRARFSRRWVTGSSKETTRGWMCSRA